MAPAAPGRRPGRAWKLLSGALALILAGGAVAVWYGLQQVAVAVPTVHQFTETPSGETSPSLIDGSSPGAEPFDPATMGANALAVPSLGISASVVPTVMDGSSLVIPSDPSKVGWFTGGAAPTDESGSVLLASHVTYAGEKGVLWPLAQVEPNMAVYLTDADGALTTWRVVSAQVVTRAVLPASVFSKTGDLRLRLVTCTGDPVTVTSGGRTHLSYPQQLIVEAERVN